jgi:hypothetical protein
VPELPRNATGKIRRVELRERAATELRDVVPAALAADAGPATDRPDGPA